MGFANNVIPVDLLKPEEIDRWFKGEDIMNDKDRLYRAAYLIEQDQDWYRWASSYWGKTEATINDLGHVKVVDKKMDESRAERWGGEFAQDSTDARWIRFEVTFEDGEVRYYQKNGEADSYGEESWSGSFVAVVKTTRVVDTFEEVR